MTEILNHYIVYIDIAILLCCLITCILDYGILSILIKEYNYDREIYEAVLLKKMSTSRRMKKAPNEKKYEEQPTISPVAEQKLEQISGDQK